MNIFQDDLTGDWWLQVDDTDVGYWPGNIFNNTHLDKADRAIWGGEINYFPRLRGHHTATQMGSGHFADEGYPRSSYFQDVWPITQLGSSLVNSSFAQYVMKPACYNLEQGSRETGIYFYFGGHFNVSTDNCGETLVFGSACQSRLMCAGNKMTRIKWLNIIPNFCIHVRSCSELLLEGPPLMKHFIVIF